ncbi:MAG TPA: hypothetical protein VGJ33_01185 [Candidatus Angelobacter sp.]
MRVQSALLLLILCTIILTGCDSDKISRLEKQNQELQAQIQKQEAAADLDLQAKCSKDAKTFFVEGWRRDKNTTLLEYMNHYNKKENKCFIFVEYHYDSDFAGPNGVSWTNDMTVYDVYENVKYGYFAENHISYYKPTIRTSDEVISCEFLDKKCTSIQEFNFFARPYMNN